MQTLHSYKIDRHIQLHQRLTTLYILNDSHIIQRHIQILQLFQFVKVLHLLDNVILQVEDLEVATQYVQVLYFYQLLLVQG